MVNPGATDVALLRLARAGQRVIVTNDKDFGELVYRQREPHAGVLFLRLKDERSENKIWVLTNFLDHHADLIKPNHFIIITERTIRVNTT